MTDFMTREQRSRAMSCVRGSETRLEKLVRSELHRRGFRFQKNVKDLPGHPDVVLPKHRAVVFVHGCFWHGHSGCSAAKLPQTNQGFWTEKIRGNVERDACQLAELRRLGWRTGVIWGCALKAHYARSISALLRWLLGEAATISIPAERLKRGNACHDQ